jgi:hypothetical protein
MIISTIEIRTVTWEQGDGKQLLAQQIISIAITINKQATMASAPKEQTQPETAVVNHLCAHDFPYTFISGGNFQW